MSDQVRQLARHLVRLEAQARHEGNGGYWYTAAWQRREVIREERSRQLRERWAEQRLARA